MRIRSAHLIAGGLALALTGWLASGQLSAGLTEADQAEVAGAAEPAHEAVAVRVSWSEAQPVEQNVTVNGWTEAARDVEIRAETSGRVIAVGPPRGSLVETGEVLLRLDPREHEAEVRSAEATFRQRELEYQAAVRLGEKGFQAETRVAEAAAALGSARASLERARIDLEHATVEAPFAGILERRPIEVGDFVDIGDQLALLIDQDPFLVMGDVAEVEVGGLEVGMPGDAVLITGATVDGRISYIASRADPATRTFRVELEVPNPDRRLPAGVSAALRVRTGEVLAHRVPASLLALDDQGRLGIKTVADDDRVRFYEADIVRAESDRLWLAGLPDRLRLITVGQGFVSEGDRVRPIDDGSIQAPLVAERRS